MLAPVEAGQPRRGALYFPEPAAVTPAKASPQQAPMPPRTRPALVPPAPRTGRKSVGSVGDSRSSSGAVDEAAVVAGGA